MVKSIFGVLHWGLTFNLLVLVLTLPYLFMPAGSRGGTIHPMNYGWGMFVVALAIAGLAFTLPSSVRDLSQGGSRTGLLSLCLSLAPFPFALGLLYLFAFVKGMNVVL